MPANAVHQQREISHSSPHTLVSSLHFSALPILYFVGEEGVDWPFMLFVIICMAFMVISATLTVQVRIKTGSLEKEMKERREVENRLQLLTTAIEQTQEGIAIVNLKGHLLFVNNAFANMHGYMPKELNGKHLSIFHTAEQMPAVEEALARGLSDGEFSGEIWHVRRDGTTFPGWMYNTLLRDSAGHPLGTIGTLRDITTMKQVENEIREKQIFLQNVFDAIRDGISILDTELNIIRVNHWMEKKYSYSLVGKKCYVAYQERQSPCQNCPSQRTLQTGETHRDVVPYIVGGKNRGWMELYTFPFRDSKGKLLGVIEHVKDITQHRKTERCLRQARYFSNAIIQSSPAFFVAIGRDGKTIMMNKAMLQALGYTAEEVAGKDYVMAFIPENERETVSDIFQKLTTSQSLEFSVYHILARDGRQLLVEWQSRLIVKGEEQVDLIFGMGIDITERKRLEQQLTQVQRMDAIGRLAGGVAHDFNNWLTVIMGANQILLEELDPGDPRRAESEEIQAAAEHAAALTRQLLAFSRRQVLEQKVIHVNSIVSDLERMLRRLIGENITFIMVLDPDLGMVKADPTQIEQVILNLVVNASDAMPQGGKITIRTENISYQEVSLNTVPEARGGDFVSLTVSDTGTGIDKRSLPHIFEPFFTRKGPGEGTGLGLAVVYGIVKQHEGWIAVDSEVGRGSTFRIYLPRVSEEGSDVEEEALSLKRPRGKGERILLVEDEDGVRTFARKSLEKNGYIVWEARDAEEALKIFERERGNFDLLACDVVLPVMNGVELSERLCAGAPHLKVLLISGYTAYQSQWRIIKEKGFPFLQKPYGIPELLNSVRDALGHSQKSDTL